VLQKNNKNLVDLGAMGEARQSYFTTVNCKQEGHLKRHRCCRITTR